MSEKRTAVLEEESLNQRRYYEKNLEEARATLDKYTSQLDREGTELRKRIFEEEQSRINLERDLHAKRLEALTTNYTQILEEKERTIRAEQSKNADLIREGREVLQREKDQFQTKFRAELTPYERKIAETLNELRVVKLDLEAQEKRHQDRYASKLAQDLEASKPRTS